MIELLLYCRRDIRDKGWNNIDFNFIKFNNRFASYNTYFIKIFDINLYDYGLDIDDKIVIDYV